MNRAARRARGYATKTYSVDLAKWMADPDKVVSRGELLVLLELHEDNMHKRQRWLGKILDMVRRKP